MSKMKLKNKLLVTDIDSIKTLLEKESVSSELYHHSMKDSTVYNFEHDAYVLEEYKKNLAGLNILVFLSTQESAKLKEEFSSFVDVKEELSYSKEYLKLFGNPKRYEFELNDVFKKCDSVGLTRMDLHFQGGMSSEKVFRVLLYRLNQIFSIYFQEYLEYQKDYELLLNSLKKLQMALHIAKALFSKRVIKTLLKDLQDMYMLINHFDKFEMYLFNFEAFIQDTENFYTHKKSHKPIYFFIQEQIENSLQKAYEAQAYIDTRSGINREFLQSIEEIMFMLEYFSSLLPPAQKKEILAKVQKLKRS